MKHRKTELTLLLFLICLLTAGTAYGNGIPLSQVNSTNYFQYVKPVRDEYGFNKGECRRKYLRYEEYFYGTCYDHWNVDLVYDEDVIEQVYDGFQSLRPGVVRGLYTVKNRMMVSWNRVNEATGYIIERRCGSGNYMTLKKVEGNTTAYVDSRNLKRGRVYEYRIRALRRIRGTTLESRCSSGQLASVLFPKKIRAVKCGIRSIRLKWNECSGADGYQIRYRIRNTNNSEKLLTCETCCTLKRLKRNRIYQVSVRSYVKEGGSRYYSVWSGWKNCSL